MDRLPLHWKQLLKLFCMVAVIHMAVPSSSARAEEVPCRGNSSSFRCFRAEAGATGQVDSWIARINASIPEGHDPVEYRHYDNVNLSQNWLWCREPNGQMTNPVRNFAVAEPMSTTDYRTTYCPTGEVRRWVRAGHVYRVPVSAIPTPGERDLNLASELNARIQSGQASTREQVIDALTQLENNEQDLQGMRPDRSETAALVAAIRTSVERLPLVVSPSAPAVREVVRPSGYITLHDQTSHENAIPMWKLMVAAAILIIVSFVLGHYSRKAGLLGKLRRAEADRKKARDLAEVRQQQIATLEQSVASLKRQLASLPSSEEILSVQAIARSWAKLEEHFNDADPYDPDEDTDLPQGKSVFSFDLVTMMIDRWLKPPVDTVRQSFETVWADLGFGDYSPEYLRLLLTNGRAFQASREKSDKIAISSLDDAYGDGKEAVQLLKEEIRRLTGDLHEANGAVILVSVLQELTITVVQRLQTFAVQFGGDVEDFPLPDPASRDEVNDFVQHVIEFAYKAHRKRGLRSEELRRTIHELTPILKERKTRIADLEKIETDLRREIGMKNVSLHDESMKSAQYRGMRFQLAEQLEEVSRAHRTQAKLLARTEGELEHSIVQASDAEQFIKDASREMHEFSGVLESLSKQDVVQGEFFKEFSHKFDDLLMKVLNYQLPKTITSNGNGANGSVRMDVPIDAASTS